MCGVDGSVRVLFARCGFTDCLVCVLAVSVVGVSIVVVFCALCFEVFCGVCFVLVLVLAAWAGLDGLGFFVWAVVFGVCGAGFVGVCGAVFVGVAAGASNVNLFGGMRVLECVCGYQIWADTAKHESTKKKKKKEKMEATSLAESSNTEPAC